MGRVKKVVDGYRYSRPQRYYPAGKKVQPVIGIPHRLTAGRMAPRELPSPDHSESIGRKLSAGAFLYRPSYISGTDKEGCCDKGIASMRGVAWRLP